MQHLSPLRTASVSIRTTRKLRLISKSTEKWIELSLYGSIALVTREQVISFGYAFKTKSPEFLSEHVRSLYIFYDDILSCFLGIFDEKHIILDFHHLITTLKSLERPALQESWCLIILAIPFFLPILYDVYRA